MAGASRGRSETFAEWGGGGDSRCKKSSYWLQELANREEGHLLEAESKLQPKSSKGMGTSVLQPQGKEFCQQSASSDADYSSSQHLPFKSVRREPRAQLHGALTPDLWELSG